MASAADQEGSAPVETVFALLVLSFLVLGVVEVAFALYGRNVVVASAHEGARAAIEFDRAPDDAARVAREIVERATGSLLDDLDVVVDVRDVGDRSVVHVHVSGRLRGWGPVPLPLTVSGNATASREAVVP